MDARLGVREAEDEAGGGVEVDQRTNLNEPRNRGLRIWVAATHHQRRPHISADSADTLAGRGRIGADGALFAIAVPIPLRWPGYAIMANPPFSERVLILGTGPLAFSIAKEIRATADVRHKIVGALNDGEGSLGELRLSGRHALLLGSIDELKQTALEFRPHRIIVALTERRRRLPVQELLNQRLQGLVIEDGIEAYERIAGKLAVESLRPSAVIFSKDFHKSRWQIGVRRALSAIVAAIGLILTAPLMALIAVFIKLDSRGPVLFRQERIGMGGRHFWL